MTSNSTVFSPNITNVKSIWLNDINNFVYNQTLPTGSAWLPSAPNQLLYANTLTSFSFTNTPSPNQILTTNASGVPFFSSTIPAGIIVDVTGNGMVSNNAGVLTGRTLTGVSGRTTITNGDGLTASPVIDISATYIGQSTITTLGTITSGIWNGTIVNPTFGGTGINNGSFSITLGGSIITAGPLTHAGAFATTITTTAITNATLPAGTTTLVPTTGTGATGTWGISISGTAATVTTNANLTGPITSVGNTTSVASQTGTGSKFVMDTSPTLITPLLGTPTSGTLTNCTSIPVNQATGLLPLANITGNATANKVLMSTTASGAPVYSTPTYPNASATVGKVIISDGTNFVASTPAYPNTAPSNGQIPIGNGSNFVASTITSGAGITVTNGSGTISIASTGSSGVNKVIFQTFTSSGTYTPSANLLYCVVEAVSAGGGGGGMASTAANNSGGGGGGGGSYGRSVFTAATIGASQTVTIGAAGAAGTAGNNAGGNGGSTSLGTLLVLTGGTGGGAGVPLTTPGTSGAGSAGGTATTATLGLPGQSGSTGHFLVASSIPYSGAGGNSEFGYGGMSSYNAAGASSAGLPGTGFGGGGGGAIGNGVVSSQAGGAGTAGYMIITEYTA